MPQYSCLVLSALLTLSAWQAGLAAAEKPPFPVHLEIESGLIEGVSEPAAGITAFKGIPYAAPPVGPLRWREPQPAAKWNGIRKADAFGAKAIQTMKFGSDEPNPESSEDCLFINVWTPAASATDKLPVLFFIHGGAGVIGSGNMEVEGLAKKGIIIVTFNYRLGILGGMGHPQLTAESAVHSCGEYAMSDVVAALKWVHNNVAAFGGDPAKVTIAGQSSGAAVAHYLTISPVTRGLFRSAIAISFPYDYLTHTDKTGNVWQKEQEGLKFLKAKGLTSIEELRTMPAFDLIAPDAAVQPFTRAVLGSGPIRGGAFFPTAYYKGLDQGLESDVPTMTGFTADDFGPPAPYLKTTTATFAASLPGMFGENRSLFLEKQASFLPLISAASDEDAKTMAKLAQIEYRMSTVFFWAKRRAKSAQSPVYTYFFDQAVASERGAYHGSDLAYFFNDLDNDKHAWTDIDRRVADQVSSYCANFVKNGNPNGEGLPNWPAFTAGSAVTMSLSASPGTRSIADSSRLPFYADLLRQAAEPPKPGPK